MQAVALAGEVSVALTRLTEAGVSDDVTHKARDYLFLCQVRPRVHAALSASAGG